MLKDQQKHMCVECMLSLLCLARRTYPRHHHYPEYYIWRCLIHPLHPLHRYQGNVCL